jgi:hypothetical protein
MAAAVRRAVVRPCLTVRRALDLVEAPLRRPDLRVLAAEVLAAEVLLRRVLLPRRPSRAGGSLAFSNRLSVRSALSRPAFISFSVW